MLTKLSKLLSSQTEGLEAWYADKLSQANKCFYSSVDLRYMGDMLVPVDTNLFPAGFNNLNEAGFAKAVELTKGLFPNTKNILLIGEDHDRNLYYLDNLKKLQSIINSAGYNCKLGSLNASEVLHYNGITESDITIYPTIKQQNSLLTSEGFIPDLILLNNDLMTGVPGKLQNINQPITPKPDNGWFKRRKSHHFTIYNSLMTELQDLFSIPSYALTTEFSVCNDLDFHSKHGMEALADKVDEVLQKIKAKYAKHNINQEPYVVIKSDHGTYGMGIMTARSSQEILRLNKKLRKQMHVTKGNVINTSVIIQEGVTTIDRVDGAIAEPMLYMINHQLVSFLYRSHIDKNEYDNLNSNGMKFTSHNLDLSEYTQACIFIARMATLAASLEI